MDKDIMIKLQTLPPDVSGYLSSDVGADMLDDMASRYFLSDKELASIVDVIRGVYLKAINIADLEKLIKNKTTLSDDDLSKFCVELASKRFLIIDKYLDGAVAKYLVSKKQTLSDFDYILYDYNEEVKHAAELEEEKKLQEQLVESVGQENAAEDAEPEFGDPEVELRDILGVLRNQVVNALMCRDLELRIAVNVTITTLLLMDKKNQDLMISELLENQELITTPKLQRQAEKLEPTIANWLQDFIAFLHRGGDDTVSTLLKAKYLADNPNVRALTTDEKEKIKRLFDLYENLRNFYTNSAKQDLFEVQIFSFSEDEQRTYLEAEGESIGATVENREMAVKKTADISKLYFGTEEDQMELDRVENLIKQKTEDDYSKLLNVFYDEIIARHRPEVIACMKLAIENGILDDFVATDPRYRELLEGYFKRNNMPTEMTEYRANPTAIKFVKYFIKYLLTERLGMVENAAARIALQYSNVYRAQGVPDLARLAYFDLESQTFRWL